MNTEKLFTNETTIKINVLKIDNKKISKSIFNQLNIISPFDKIFNLKENVQLLGYINDRSKWIIWTNGEFLYKFDITELYPLMRINLDRNTIFDLVSVSSELVNSLYSFQYDDALKIISSVLDSNEQNEIRDKIEKVDKIIKETLKRQIFI